MEIFYEGWHIVKEFTNAHGKMPKEIGLSSGLDRIVCKKLVEKSKFPVLDVIESIKHLVQPHLLTVKNSDTIITSMSGAEANVNRIVTPVSLINK